LGIGANTANLLVWSMPFSFSALPFKDSGFVPRCGCGGTFRQGRDIVRAFRRLDFLDYRQQNTTFEQFAASLSIPTHANLTGNGEPERLTSAAVTGNYFQALGVNPKLGVPSSRRMRNPPAIT
jgi:hypothetical protein